MGRFEPQVLENIKRSRRKVLLEDSLMLILLSFPLAAGALLARFAFHRGQELLLLVLLSCTIVGAVIFTVRVHRSYRRFLKIAHDFNPVSLPTFQRALEAVSLGAGIEIPRIVILDIPTVNLVPFKGRGEYSIGITREAVETPILGHEAEALMAHEVSHILIGDVLRPLDIWRSKALPVASLFLLVLLAICTPLFLLLNNGEPWVNTLMMNLSWLLLLWAVPMTAFISRMLEAVRRHDEILADSLAVKTTGNPEALKDMVEWVSQQFKDSEALPLENYCNKHLFMCPRELNRDYSIWSIKNLFLAEWFDPKVRTRWEHETTCKRIDNLTAIEQGHWPTFEC